MTNILIDALPETVVVDGQDVPIRTEFRECLRVILAFEDHELTPSEQALILLDNLYPEPPAHVEEALRQGIRFLNGGQDVQEETEEAPSLRLYGFEHDAALIFAAFRQTHGIDLTTVTGLHWWAFMALFMDLGSETTFCQLVSLRQRVKTGKANAEERAAYHALGDTASLPEPDTRTADEREREAEFMRIVMESEARRHEARHQARQG